MRRLKVRPDGSLSERQLGKQNGDNRRPRDGALHCSACPQGLWKPTALGARGMPLPLPERRRDPRNNREYTQTSSRYATVFNPMNLSLHRGRALCCTVWAVLWQAVKDATPTESKGSSRHELRVRPCGSSRGYAGQAERRRM
ncbi:hypothetical protein AAFF_G00156630 [Aldrovandia affinis]|uniref:Uncharacterized protein n=1 Tax=Aldrovandia affinis TaxID=143900 RepID=A0AAD7RNN6_9TELE|nr:hypothetical protein AAFF_G00156630 [Aldrovandia affinis]